MTWSWSFSQHKDGFLCLKHTFILDCQEDWGFRDESVGESVFDEKDICQVSTRPLHGHWTLFFFPPNWLKKAACEMRIHACSFQLTTQEWPHQTFKWQVIMNGNDCRFHKHLWNLLWCVHANLSGSSALGQKGVWEGCRHTAFSIGFKITLNP